MQVTFRLAITERVPVSDDVIDPKLVDVVVPEYAAEYAVDMVALDGVTSARYPVCEVVGK